MAKLITYLTDKILEPYDRWVDNKPKREKGKEMRQELTDSGFIDLREAFVEDIKTDLDEYNLSPQARRLLIAFEKELRTNGRTHNADECLEELMEAVSMDRRYRDRDRDKIEKLVKRLGKELLSVRRVEMYKKPQQDIFNNPYKKTTMKFICANNPSVTESIICREDTEYAMPGSPSYQTEPDRLYHAKVTVYNYRGRNLEPTYTKDVYLYQPNLTCNTKESFGQQNTYLGPFLSRRGTLDSSKCYCFKDPNGRIFLSGLPKREALSNQVFDLDPNNYDQYQSVLKELFQNDPDLAGRYIKFEYDKGPDGKIMPIPKEREFEVIEQYKLNPPNIKKILADVKNQISIGKEIAAKEELERKAAERAAAEQAQDAQRKADDQQRREDRDAQAQRDKQQFIMDQMYRRVATGQEYASSQGLSNVARMAEGMTPSGGMGMPTRPMGPPPGEGPGRRR